MTIQHLFPTAKPTLDLNFAGERSLDPRITFSRSSIGSYVDEDGIIRYAAEDEPRFDHDPLTGESLGLLLEQSRTNSVEYSEDLSKAYWNKQNCILGATTTAPDGTNSAYLVIPNNVDTTNHRVKIGVNGLEQGRSQSCFAKAGGYNYATFKGQNVDCVFDLSTGTASNSQGEMIPYPNGWYRCILNTSAFMGSGVGWGCSPFAYGGGAGNETDGVYLWGMQWENLVNFASSYIPASGAGEDRDPDKCSIQGDNFSSWYNQTEGTIISEYTRNGVGTGSSNILYMDNYSNNILKCPESNKDATRFWISNNGSQAFNSSQTLFEMGLPMKAALALKVGDTKGIYNGIFQNANDNTANIGIPVVSRLCIGGKDGNFLTVKRVSYYSRRLSNEQLEVLTS